MKFLPIHLRRIPRKLDGIYPLTLKHKRKPLYSILINTNYHYIRLDYIIKIYQAMVGQNIPHVFLRFSFVFLFLNCVMRNPGL